MSGHTVVKKGFKPFQCTQQTHLLLSQYNLKNNSLVFKLKKKIIRVQFVQVGCTSMIMFETFESGKRVSIC